MGFSAGADHIMRLVASKDGFAFDVHGLVLFGCNLGGETTAISRFFAGLRLDDTAGVLPQLRSLSADVETLADWLALHKYLVHTLGKLGTDVEGVKRYGADVAAPFESRGESPFVAWYRAAVERVRHVRCVFSNGESMVLDKILSQHLDDNVLGDLYSEETIVHEHTRHMDLMDPTLVLRHVTEIVEAARAR
jgi:hypothetical protein